MTELQGWILIGILFFWRIDGIALERLWPFKPEPWQDSNSIVGAIERLRAAIERLGP